jgi:hypothetical protein
VELVVGMKQRAFTTAGGRLKEWYHGTSRTVENSKAFMEGLIGLRRHWRVLAMSHSSSVLRPLAAADPLAVNFGRFPQLGKDGEIKEGAEVIRRLEKKQGQPMTIGDAHQTPFQGNLVFKVMRLGLQPLAASISTMDLPRPRWRSHGQSGAVCALLEATDAGSSDLLYRAIFSTLRHGASSSQHLWVARHGLEGESTQAGSSADEGLAVAVEVVASTAPRERLRVIKVSAVNIIVELDSHFILEIRMTYDTPRSQDGEAMDVADGGEIKVVPWEEGQRLCKLALLTCLTEYEGSRENVLETIVQVVSHELVCERVAAEVTAVADVPRSQGIAVGARWARRRARETRSQLIVTCGSDFLTDVYIQGCSVSATTSTTHQGGSSRSLPLSSVDELGKYLAHQFGLVVARWVQKAAVAQRPAIASAGVVLQEISCRLNIDKMATIDFDIDKVSRALHVEFRLLSHAEKAASTDLPVSEEGDLAWTQADGATIVEKVVNAWLRMWTPAEPGS